MREICQVANYFLFRMPRNGEVVVHNNASNTINRRDKRFPDERRIVAGCPNLHAARDEFAIQFSRICNVRCPCVRAHVHAQLDQLLSRAFGQIRRKRGE